jgi:hypothetical protein
MLATHSKEDPAITQTIAALTKRRSALRQVAREFQTLQDRLTVEHGILKLDKRSVVPASLQRTLISQYHEASLATHRTTSAVKSFLQARYFWNRLPAMVDEFVAACPICQQIGDGPSLFADMVFCARRVNGTLCIDLVGRLPSTPRGHQFFCSMLCKFSRFVEAPPLINDTTEVVIQAIWSGWICVHGIPSAVISDNEPCFKSVKMTSFLQGLGCKVAHASAYHPQTNGAVERWHRFTKKRFKLTVLQTLVGIPFFPR